MLRRPGNQHLAFRNSTVETSLFVREMDDLSGALSARYGSQTEHIIVGRLNVVLRRWTISALGQSTLYGSARWLSLTISRVGGVVSETSFKFFTQFVSWGAVYCIFNLIVMANYLAEDRGEVSAFLLSCGCPARFLPRIST